MRLIRSELMKIRTTNIWWLFGIGVFVFTALAVTYWIGFGNEEINTAAQQANVPYQPPEEGMPPAMEEIYRQQWERSHDIDRTLAKVASDIYTSGQYFGLLFVMLLGAILVTNEFYHQTATATFLTTPQRTKVILAKVGTAAFAAGFFWIFTTVISVTAGAIFFNSKGYGTQLGEWAVTRSILMNGLAYGLWGILGVGLGVLIRNQIGAVVTGAAGYIIGTPVVQTLALGIAVWLEIDWLLKAIVAWPAVASQVMISPEIVYPGAPKWWAGALVLVGYGIVFGSIGTLITRKRDIS